MVGEMHQDMKRRDLLQMLIQIVSKEDAVEIQDEAAIAIANVAKDFGNKADIRKAGGVRALVKLLESPDPDVKRSSALALSHLLNDFSNRSEVRSANGLRPLLDMLSSDYPEVQENALNSLLQCTEDHLNAREVHKLGGVRKILDYTAMPQVEHISLALLVLCNLLDEQDAILALMEAQGLQTLVKLVNHDDSKVRQSSCTAIVKSCKNLDAQHTLREIGLLSALGTNLQSSDILVSSSAAAALGASSKNEKTQNEVLKLAVIETLLKQLGHEQNVVRREAMGALAVLCSNSKIRLKFKGLDAVNVALKLLGDDDVQTVVNSIDFLASFADDVTLKNDLIKQGVVGSIVQCLDKSDPNILITGLTATGRFALESEGQQAISKLPKAVSRFVELLSHPNPLVCKASAYCLGNASQYQPNAVTACGSGAIEQLLNLSAHLGKNSINFAGEALQKVLKYDVPVKYRLQDRLDSDNQIADGFYDMGHRGTTNTFPNLPELQKLPVDNRREVILVDSKEDPAFLELVNSITQSIQGSSAIEAVQKIALRVADVMGGPVAPEQLADFQFKFKITELKVKLQSNVIPIGSIEVGTFYHRALLFKAICDRVAISPCTLIRGDYNRAWNIIDFKRISLPGSPETKWSPDVPPGPAIVDLMFEPGSLLPTDSQKADAYRRIE
ncbi:armadillo-type protein [Gorgonomyces haynaldii]|nr:armadillo-type protein [Gorgonomyces haynaldii]